MRLMSTIQSWIYSWTRCCLIPFFKIIYQQRCTAMKICQLPRVSNADNITVFITVYYCYCTDIIDIKVCTCRSGSGNLEMVRPYSDDLIISVYSYFWKGTAVLINYSSSNTVLENNAGYCGANASTKSPITAICALVEDAIILCWREVSKCASFRKCLSLTCWYSIQRITKQAINVDSNCNNLLVVQPLPDLIAGPSEPLLTCLLVPSCVCS